MLQIWSFDLFQKLSKSVINTEKKNAEKGESWGIELCGEGPTEIRRVRAGGPADYAGLQAGDIVLQETQILKDFFKSWREMLNSLEH